MRVVEELDQATRVFHIDVDDEVLRLQQANVSPADYWRFLTRCYGWVTPVEAAILGVPRLDEHIDSARFHKHELVRSDLLCFRMREMEIAALPRCLVPPLASPEEALGWAYPIERSTRSHANVYRHLASLMPGEVAFTSSYLKCYLGTSGQTWLTFTTALDRVADSPTGRNRVIDAATTAFRTLVDWRRHHSNLSQPSSSDSSEQHSA